mgnify:CR=1 FL=1
MTISFNQVAGNAWIVPGSYIEFDNSLANTASLAYKTLVIAPRLSTGLQAANEIHRITSKEQAQENLGIGSAGGLMVAAALAASSVIDLHVLAVDDNGAGTEAAASIVVNGAANKAGLLNIVLGEQFVQVPVASGQTSDAITTGITVAVAAKLDWPLLAVVNGANTSQIDFTFRHKGAFGNDAQVQIEWVGELPTTPTFSNNGVADMSGGAGNPDLAPVIASMGDEWYQVIINPFNDSDNMTVLETELENRFDAMTQLGGFNVTGYRGSHGETTTYVANRNSFTTCLFGTNESQSMAFVAAATVGAIASQELEKDPARPLQTLEIDNFNPALRNKRWDAQERNILLREGVSTYTVGDDGRPRIESLVTTYNKNAGGFDDNSYRYLNTLATLQRVRWEQRKMIASKFPRSKLAEDTDLDKFGEGQDIMTPSRFKAEMLVLYRSFVERGWLQDFDNYKATFHAEINIDNKSRIDYTDQPTLISGMRLVAGKMQFK